MRQAANEWAAVERMREGPTFEEPMKTTYLAIAASLVFVSCKEKSIAPEAGAPASAPEVKGTVKLFNGKDLEGWSHVLVDGGKKDEVWSVEDGVLVCKGQPFGYLFTGESYQDFTLTFEWRWPEGKEAGNSGVLLRIAGEPNGFMPTCVEAQLKTQNAGDIWAFFGAKVEGDAERKVEIKDHKDLKDFVGVKGMKVVEKPVGEWNKYEIKVSGGDIELTINGELVNRASGLDILSGPIGFQSEGAEIHFRNIELRR